jgi:hypothetical protein
MRPMVLPGGPGTMATWQGHPSRPRPRCASAWPPGHASAGPSSPASPSATTASSPTSPASSPTAPTLPLCRLRHQLGLRHLPRQPRRLREIRPAQRLPGRHPAGSPRLRLRPLPRRHYGLARPATPDELTGATTRRADQSMGGAGHRLNAPETDAGSRSRSPALSPTAEDRSRLGSHSEALEFGLNPSFRSRLLIQGVTGCLLEQLLCSPRHRRLHGE